MTTDERLKLMYSKPHLAPTNYWSGAPETDRKWVCIQAKSTKWTQAYGPTAQEAYANWAAKEYK